jgi:NAD(P)H-hydrate repair Nnr-like enzyme with NAD(P)H-hydrate dehydratase domain
VILTPHIKEMAALLKCKTDRVSGDPFGAVQKAVKKFKVNVLLKGAETLLALTDGRFYRHRGGNMGLATGGSGDTLAGLMGGLLARGAPPAEAAIWAVYVHARAGERLAQRIGPLGFLARELPAEFPGLLKELGMRKPVNS